MSSDALKEEPSETEEFASAPEDAESDQAEDYSERVEEEGHAQDAPDAKLPVANEDAPRSASPPTKRDEPNPNIDQAADNGLHERQGVLSQADKTKAQMLDQGAAGRSLFDRIAQEEKPQDAGWGAWGGWAATAWTQASTVVNTVSDAAGKAALSLLEDQPQPSEGQEGENDAERHGSVTGLATMGLESVAAALDKTVNTATDTMLNVSTKLQNVYVEDGMAKRQVMEQSLGVLENLGKKTMSVIIDKDPEAMARRKAEKEARMAESAEVPDEEKEVSFAQQFQVHGGVQAMADLEVMSSQASQTAQSLLRQMKTSAKQASDAHMEKVAALFMDVEDIDEDDVSELVFDDLIELGLRAEQAGGLSDRVEKEQAWSDAFLAQLGEEEGKERLHAAPESLLQEVYSRALDSTAWYSAVSVGYIKSLGAKLLQAREELAADVPGVITRAECIRQLVQWQCLEVSRISSIYAASMNGVRDAYELGISSTPEDKVQLEQLDDQVSMHTTNVFLEAGSATSNITDAFQLLMPIFRVLVASTK